MTNRLLDTLWNAHIMHYYRINRHINNLVFKVKHMLIGAEARKYVLVLNSEGLFGTIPLKINSAY